MNKKIIILIFAVILVLSLIASVMIITPEKRSSERINILLLGADARTPSHHGFTDSISVVSIDKNTQEVSFLSIPRDTRVQIHGKKVDKINHAYAYGDIDTTKKTVENFLNIKIDYYILVDFQDFKKLVDSLGGITMYVEPHVSAVRPELNGKSGMTKLTGEEALIYVRFRQDSKSEAGRMDRHRRAIEAIMNEVLDPSNILSNPENINNLRETVETDIPATDIPLFQKLSSGLNMKNAKVRVVPGTYTHINGINYMIPDKEKTEEIVVELGLRK